MKGQSDKGNRKHKPKRVNTFAGFQSPWRLLWGDLVEQAKQGLVRVSYLELASMLSLPPDAPTLNIACIYSCWRLVPVKALEVGQWWGNHSHRSIWTRTDVDWEENWTFLPKPGEEMCRHILCLNYSSRPKFFSFKNQHDMIGFIFNNPFDILAVLWFWAITMLLFSSSKAFYRLIAASHINS